MSLVGGNMKINIIQNNLAMWFICEAIRDNIELINDFDNTQNGEHDIRFIVDGVELNFLNVIDSIGNSFESAVKKKAYKMYLEEFDRRSDEISSELEKIADRLKEIRRKKFPDIDWQDD